MRMVFSLAVAGLTVVALTSSALAAGDAEKGKAAFAKCGICHQVGPGAKTLVGPELNGIVGRKAASVADYSMYSAGMAQNDCSWSSWTSEVLETQGLPGLKLAGLQLLPLVRSFRYGASHAD